MPDDPPMTPMTHADAARLARAMEVLSDHRFVRIHNSALRLMWYQFLRGLAFGFGTFLGASALVSVVVLLLSQFEFVPVVGSFVTRVIEEIQPR